MAKASRSSTVLDEIDLDVLDRVVAGRSVSRIASELNVPEQRVTTSLGRIQAYMESRGKAMVTAGTKNSEKLFRKLAVQAGQSVDTLNTWLERAR